MRGSGPNSEVTTLVKFAGGGETSKIRCLQTRSSWWVSWKDVFLLKLESRKPAPSNLLLSSFQKSAFLPIFSLCVGNESPTFAGLLVSVCPRDTTRALRLLGFAELCGKKNYSNRRTTFFCLFCFLNALSLLMFCFCLLLLINTFFLCLFSFFANS